jgi:DNA (cytosine-5)-methyltransferase 1
MIPSLNSYFSGAGLMDEGLRRGGVNVQQSFEIDEDACKVARSNGHNSTTCDITQKLVQTDRDCDAMVATYPCTKYSTIADIHGARTGDELYLHFLRHLAVKRPEVYVAENVPGMRKFPIVMETMTKLAGYFVTVFCPVQSQMWLPQKRDRLIIIGSRKPFAWRPPESSTRTLLSEIVDENPVVEIPDYFYTRLKGSYRDLPIVSDPEHYEDLAPTCVAHYAKDVSTRAIKDKRFPHGIRPYTVREYARLQGLPDTFKFNCNDRLAYKFIGNGVSVPVGEWVGRELVRYFN